MTSIPSLTMMKVTRHRRKSMYSPLLTIAARPPALTARDVVRRRRRRRRGRRRRRRRRRRRKERRRRHRRRRKRRRRRRQERGKSPESEDRRLREICRRRRTRRIAEALRRKLKWNKRTWCDSWQMRTSPQKENWWPQPALQRIIAWRTMNPILLPRP